MEILEWEDTAWSMEQDYTDWSSHDIADWLWLLHGDLEQYGDRILFIGLDGERFDRLTDPKYVRGDMGVKIASHVNAIVRAATQRMIEYDRLQKKKHDRDENRWINNNNFTPNTTHHANNFDFPQISPAISPAPPPNDNDSYTINPLEAFGSTNYQVFDGEGMEGNDFAPPDIDPFPGFTVCLSLSHM